jgi:hypothetical protein
MDNTQALPPQPWWTRQPHLLLAAHLLLLHTLTFGGWELPSVRILWLVALGLFLLWQPFVAGKRPMRPHQAAILLAVVAVSTWLLNPWLILIWCNALAAVIGGRVLWTSGRRERNGYLLAFAYLVLLIILGAVPEAAPGISLAPLPRATIGLYMPVALLLLPAFPARTLQRRNADTFDLFYGLLVFLALAVFILGALAFTFVAAISYVEALARTSLTIAAALLVLAWAWNPRGGFSGIGSAFSRYLLSLGLPLEQWLVLLAETSERENHPVRFLETSIAGLARMPWVAGCRWQAASDAGTFGAATSFSQAYARDELALTVFFRHPPSPALRWHVDWLLRLAGEFYQVKFQAHELQRMGYLQAVYETGARVTHDVKNLLQSLQTLCYAVAQPGDPAAVAQLLARQLPQIAERLKATLDKLQRPQIQVSRGIAAGDWWARLQERHGGNGIAWHADLREPAELPEALFDSVAENLLHNALSKRQQEGGIEIAVDFAVDRNGPVLSVRDSGQAVVPAVVATLFRAPTESAAGLGIGLYHAAKQAAETGYRLQLAENRAGAVCFRLSAAS